MNNDIDIYQMVRDVKDGFLDIIELADYRSDHATDEIEKRAWKEAYMTAMRIYNDLNHEYFRYFGKY